MTARLIVSDPQHLGRESVGNSVCRAAVRFPCGPRSALHGLEAILDHEGDLIDRRQPPTVRAVLPGPRIARGIRFSAATIESLIVEGDPIADIHVIEAEERLLGPCEPIDGYVVAVIDDGGVPVELIQTDLSDDEIGDRARSGQDMIRREPGSRSPPRQASA